MAKRVVVFKTTVDELIVGDDERSELDVRKDTLASLRGLGVRFSVEELDGTEITLTAWLEDKEPRQPKERKALGSTPAAPLEGGLS